MALPKKTKAPSFQANHEGLLHAYLAHKGSKDYIYVDLGFSITRQISSQIQLGQRGSIVQSTKYSKGYKVKRAKTQVRKVLYTYKVYVEKVVDGDTVVLNVDLGFDTFIQERFRLRGIDVPEVKTKKGQRAKRFLQRVLRKAEMIIVKTHGKDKFGRYLIDIWADHQYLNQQLLERGLAKSY